MGSFSEINYTISLVFYGECIVLLILIIFESLNSINSWIKKNTLYNIFHFINLSYSNDNEAMMFLFN